MTAVLACLKQILTVLEREERGDIELLSVPKAAKVAGVDTEMLREKIALGEIMSISWGKGAARGGETRTTRRWIREWQDRTALERTAKAKEFVDAAVEKLLYGNPPRPGKKAEHV